MSHNVTPSAKISPAQSYALEALLWGASVTKAAEAAGVARETVSRWVHHDPVFMAELQNIRAEMAAQTRLALEALGMRAVATLSDAIRNQGMRPSKLRAACVVLKMIGADRVETLAPTTPHEVNLRLCEREIERLERQAKLEDIVKSSQESVRTAATDSEAQSEDAGERLENTGAPETCAAAPEAADEPGEMLNPEFAWTYADSSRGRNELPKVGVRHPKKRARRCLPVFQGVPVSRPVLEEITVKLELPALTGA